MKILLFICIALIWGGFQGTYTGLKNLTKTEVTYSEYVQEIPKKEWLAISECRLDLLGTAYSERFGEISELYIPILGSDSEDSTIHVIYQTKDEKFIELLTKMSTVNDQMEILKLMGENADIFIGEHTIEGVKKFGIELDSKEKSKIASLVDNVHPNFIILDGTEKPALGKSLIMLLIGLGIPVLLFRGGRKKKVVAVEDVQEETTQEA